MTAPTISVIEEEESGNFILLATSYGSTAPAGERLFHAEPWPAIKFSHANQHQAMRDAALLRQYISENWTAKSEKKTKKTKD